MKGPDRVRRSRVRWPPVPRPEVPGKAAYVGPPRTDHSKIDAVGTELLRAEFLDRDLDRRQLDKLPPSCQAMRPPAADLLRRECRGHLETGSDKRAHGFDQPGPVDLGGSRVADGLALAIRRRRLPPELDGSDVVLRRRGHEASEARRRADRDGKDPRRHGVQGSEMADLLRPEPLAHARDDIMGGEAPRLVDDDDPDRCGGGRVPVGWTGHRARAMGWIPDQAGCYSSSGSSSASSERRPSMRIPFSNESS
jgi:hypothetical protein